MELYAWRSKEDKFLDGELLFVPEELKDKVEGERYRSERRELTYLIWAAIRSTPAERRGGWRRVHHRRFNYESSYSTDHRALLWLAENGFVELDKENSYYADPKNGFPKKYRLISKKSPTLIELKKKSLIRGPDPFTQDGISCQYTRQILDRLEVDREGVKQELCNTIYKHHQLVNMTSKSTSSGENGENTEEKDFIRGLYTFGLPLLHLVNKRGAIKRGKKGNRLFSPMTNVKKTYRKYFTLEGEPLVWLDMQAAHPTLLGNLSDNQKLVDDCISDGFYGRIMDELGVDRDIAKKRYMSWAYDKHRPESKMTSVMEEHYPTAASYVVDQKRDNYKRYSWITQREEADIFIDSVYERLSKENIPALTIHDCLGTTPAYKDRVKNLLQQEMDKRGYRVEIKEEKH